MGDKFSFLFDIFWCFILWFCSDPKKCGVKLLGKNQSLWGWNCQLMTCYGATCSCTTLIYLWTSSKIVVIVDSRCLIEKFRYNKTKHIDFWDTVCLAKLATLQFIRSMQSLECVGFDIHHVFQYLFHLIFPFSFLWYDMWCWWCRARVILKENTDGMVLWRIWVIKGKRILNGVAIKSAMQRM